MRRLKNYFLRHCQAAVFSLGQFSRVPVASLMTCFIIGITLALPTALFVALNNIRAMSAHLQQTIQLTLYLKEDVSSQQINQLIEKIRLHPQVADVASVSPEQGLKELQQTGFSGNTFSLPENPLPWALVVMPKNSMGVAHLAEELRTLPAVESVQLDQQWVKRLSSIMSVAERLAYALTFFLSIAVFLIITNAIRAATQQNHKEIQLIQLIGGTPAFIRRPFLYAGILYGLLGSIVAWQLVDGLLVWLDQPFLQLTTLYDSTFQLRGIGFFNTFILLGSSILLGLLGSWLAVSRHLKKN
jgi:cell division transport system permease protein